jgi:hypothetical protein
MAHFLRIGTRSPWPRRTRAPSPKIWAGAGMVGANLPRPRPLSPYSDAPPPSRALGRTRKSAATVMMRTYAASNPRLPCSQLGSRAGARGSGDTRTPRCSRILRTTGGLVIVADISEREAIVALLTHLGVPTEPPPIARARDGGRAARRAPRHRWCTISPGLSRTSDAPCDAGRGRGTPACGSTPHGGQETLRGSCGPAWTATPLRPIRGALPRAALDPRESGSPSAGTRPPRRPSSGCRRCARTEMQEDAAHGPRRRKRAEDAHMPRDDGVRAAAEAPELARRQDVRERLNTARARRSPSPLG